MARRPSPTLVCCRRPPAGRDSGTPRAGAAQAATCPGVDTTNLSARTSRRKAATPGSATPRALQDDRLRHQHRRRPWLSGTRAAAWSVSDDRDDRPEDGVSLYGSCLFDGEPDRKYRTVIQANPAPANAGDPSQCGDAQRSRAVVVMGKDETAGGDPSVAMTVANANVTLRRTVLIAGKGGLGGSVPPYTSSAAVRVGDDTCYTPGGAASASLWGQVDLEGLELGGRHRRRRRRRRLHHRAGRRGRAAGRCVDRPAARELGSRDDRCRRVQPHRRGLRRRGRRRPAGAVVRSRRRREQRWRRRQRRAVDRRRIDQLRGRAERRGLPLRQCAGRTGRGRRGRRRCGSMPGRPRRALACRAAARPPISFRSRRHWRRGESLAGGQSLYSPNLRFQFILRDDSNLCLLSAGNPLWCSQTQGQGIYQAIMQSDGNFCMYETLGQVLPICSGSPGHPGARLSVQDSGHAQVVDTSGAVLWSVP